MAEATKKTRDKKTIQRQIHTNALKFLTEQANKNYQEALKEDPEAKYEPPTDDQIRTECKKRWQAHLDRKEDKKDVSSFFV